MKIPLIFFFYLQSSLARNLESVQETQGNELQENPRAKKQQRCLVVLIRVEIAQLCLSRSIYQEQGELTIDLVQRAAEQACWVTFPTCLLESFYPPRLS